MPLSIVVAIPVKNEEAQIGACLEALEKQTRRFDRLVLLLNNCTDNTPAICNRFRARIPGVEVYEEALYGPLATAGEARRRALHIATRSGANSVILTTDADAVAEPSWIERNMREIEAGAEVVCGMAKIDPLDAMHIPRTLHDDASQEATFLAMLDEISALLNPDPSDPWPRHQQQSGASIAVRRDILNLAGGPPHVPACEDRALIARLRLVDARVRHAPDIIVRVSGRLEGRALGGMAETIKRRIVRQDALTDEKAEPAIDAFWRAVAQNRLYAARQGQEDGLELARDLLIDPEDMRRMIEGNFHGAAWAEIQSASPVLRRRRVPFAALGRETCIALNLRNKLLLEDAAYDKDRPAAFMSDA